MLIELPTLQALKEGKTLTLYVAVSVVLVTNTAHQKPVYFHSKALQDMELQYEPLEKLVFSVVTVTRRLQPYFQTHKMKYKQAIYSLLQLLHKPSIFGRLTKWAVELSELDIRYIPTIAIKA